MPDDGGADQTRKGSGRRRGWWSRHRWAGIALLLVCTGFAPAPPQLPPKPPDEYQQEDDDPLDSLPSWPPALAPDEPRPGS